MTIARHEASEVRASWLGSLSRRAQRVCGRRGGASFETRPKRATPLAWAEAVAAKSRDTLQWMSRARTLGPPWGIDAER
jgi:hypothetical protein